MLQLTLWNYYRPIRKYIYLWKWILGRFYAIRYELYELYITSVCILFYDFNYNFKVNMRYMNKNWIQSNIKYIIGR